MIVDGLSPQAVALSSGAIVASADRFHLVYARAGKALRFAVEPLDAYYVRLPAHPRWDDGAPLTLEEAHQAQRDLAEALAHWDLPCEFVGPGDPRILATVQDVVRYLTDQLQTR